MDSDPYLIDICQEEEGKYTFYIYIYSANAPYFLITFLKAHKINEDKCLRLQALETGNVRTPT